MARLAREALAHLPEALGQPAGAGGGGPGNGQLSDRRLAGALAAFGEAERWASPVEHPAIYSRLAVLLAPLRVAQGQPAEAERLLAAGLAHLPGRAAHAAFPALRPSAAGPDRAGAQRPGRRRRAGRAVPEPEPGRAAGHAGRGAAARGTGAAGGRPRGGGAGAVGPGRARRCRPTWSRVRAAAWPRARPACGCGWAICPRPSAACLASHRPSEPAFRVAQETFTLARLHLAAPSCRGPVELLAPAQAAAEADGRRAHQAEALALSALAAQAAATQPRRGRRWRRRCAGRASRLARLFIDEGAPMRTLLQACGARPARRGRPGGAAAAGLGAARHAAARCAGHGRCRRRSPRASWPCCARWPLGAQWADCRRADSEPEHRAQPRQASVCQARGTQPHPGRGARARAGPAG